jgi:hypothetical protein
METVQMRNTQSLEQIHNLVFTIKQNMSSAYLFFDDAQRQMMELDEKLIDYKDEKMVKKDFEKSKIWSF